MQTPLHTGTMDTRLPESPTTSGTTYGIRDEIVDGAFVGDGCAISQASADMMLDLIIGKKKDEALRLANLFLEMIKGTAKGDELEPLEEASILQDVSHMPARVKCAVLGWHTMEEMFKKAAEGKIIPGMSVTTENK